MIPDPLFAQAAAADSAALAAAAGSAEEALGCHRDALVALAAGWHSETGSNAVELLQRQCAQATDIVAELHRAAGELRSLHDDLADLTGGRTESGTAEAGEQPQAEASGPRAPTPVPGSVGEGPPSPPDPPAMVPAQSLPPAAWAAQAGGGPPTVAPSTTPLASPAWQTGGAVPALPDLGAALVGLVAQIAQTLGPYAETPGPVPGEDPVDQQPPSAEAEPRPPHRKPPLPVQLSTDPPSLPESAVPKSIAPQPQPPAQTPADPSPDLLAAERPPDPGVPPKQPPPPVSAAVPQTPPAPVTPPPAPAVETETPCEIAADELPKVGE